MTRPQALSKGRGVPLIQPTFSLFIFPGVSAVVCDN
jgi:hypothetical protein